MSVNLPTRVSLFDAETQRCPCGCQPERRIIQSLLRV